MLLNSAEYPGFFFGKINAITSGRTDGTGRTNDHVSNPGDGSDRVTSWSGFSHASSRGA
jgi:hypothetical protein